MKKNTIKQKKENMKEVKKKTNIKTIRKMKNKGQQINNKYAQT